MKRIVICADGTWNRPEEDLSKDFPTNILKVARSVRPEDDKGAQQIVFYDWGVGSYYDSAKGGAFGVGINKNIQDAYRFIVQNYDPNDQLYFLGFSRGAYTVRSLSGMIYNCGILRRRHANRIQLAFDLYKDADVHPDDDKSVRFRSRYSVKDVRVRFIGVWDTVGSLGVPLRMLGFLNEKHLFHDKKIGPNVDCARHALAIDELRDDFEPTIWKPRAKLDLKQVWFAGVHTDVGGGYKPDKNGSLLSDITLGWMINEAEAADLSLESHVKSGMRPSAVATKHEEHEGFYKLLGKHVRKIPRHTFIHASVKERYSKRKRYRPKTLVKYLNKYGWDRVVS